MNSTRLYNRSAASLTILHNVNRQIPLLHISKPAQNDSRMNDLFGLTIKSDFNLSFRMDSSRWHVKGKRKMWASSEDRAVRHTMRQTLRQTHLSINVDNKSECQTLSARGVKRGNCSSLLFLGGRPKNERYWSKTEKHPYLVLGKMRGIQYQYTKKIGMFDATFFTPQYYCGSPPLPPCWSWDRETGAQAWGWFLRAITQ